MSLSDRLKNAFLKPVVAAETGPDSRVSAPKPTTIDEIETSIARADDKERLIGLLLAPVAALIALIVTGSLIGNDPKARLANGAVNLKHVNPSLYLAVGATALVLALLMLVLAWMRKRLFMGIVMALYGLSVFNLHFWGFGVPFLLAAGWYLVRAYRLQQSLKDALQSGGGRGGRSGVDGGPPGSGRPNKRFTPPTGR